MTEFFDCILGCCGCGEKREVRSARTPGLIQLRCEKCKKRTWHNLRRKPTHVID